VSLPSGGATDALPHARQGCGQGHRDGGRCVDQEHAHAAKELYKSLT